MTTATAAAGAPTTPQAPPALLRISPQTFQFTASKVSSGLVSKLKIKNLLTSHVGYKFKTNAPLRYSVKPVLGVLAPGQSIEVFVRCESWVNPQDRFLLQSVALDEKESQGIDAVTWKEIDRRRIIENFIQCSSSSTLVMREPQDDGGSLSSSSSNSSRTTASVVSSTQSSGLSEKTRPQRPHPSNHQGQQKRPTVAHVHAAGRKMSTSSSVSSNTSSPGSYPTLFTSSKGGAPSRSSNSSAPGLEHGLLSKPVGYLTTTLSNSKHFLRTMSQFLAARKYTKIQMFTVSVICLLLGLLLPLEKIFMWSSGASSSNTTSSSSTQFRSGVIHRKPIFSSSTASSGILPVMVTTAQAGPAVVAKEADPADLPPLEEIVPEEVPRPEVWMQDESMPAATVEGAL
ncbi:Motile sperm domain-containing protein 2 [Mortierella alpina]|nr:Motile sperm domain-containing protein 2 [Mortierella alpina]